MDIAERQGTNLTLTLLDWEKAFDKVDQSKLVKVLQRLCIPERMVNLIRNIYRYAQFRVVQGEHSSAFHRQESGIRQGCPLSPYLFGIIMTAIFQDIKTELNTPKQLQPIHGINYAEVLYADDTLLFGTHTQTINKLLRQVQVESAKYNLALNFEKCINLTINRKQSSVKFMNGAQVPQKTQATYLGATLTDAVDNHREVIKRIGKAAAAANQLRIFWSQARTTIAWKIRVLDSIVISKLLYSLETIQLTKSEQNRLDAWQHKMLRRILNVPPTHLDRTWTNQRVVNTLTQAHNYTHVSLSAKWTSRKLTLLGHILRATSADPMREVLFHPHTNIPRQEHIRRVGKPRAHWLIETLQDAYKHIHPDRVFDANNQEQINMLAERASARAAPFHARG